MSKGKVRSHNLDIIIVIFFSINFNKNEIIYK